MSRTDTQNSSISSNFEEPHPAKNLVSQLADAQQGLFALLLRVHGSKAHIQRDINVLSSVQ